MAEPVVRASFMGAHVQTQALVVEDQTLFFVDILAPSDEQSVTVGWSPDRSKFGVYVNGVCVHPIPEEPTP